MSLPRLALASQSPRRLQLLESAGFEVVVVRSRPEPALAPAGHGVQQAVLSALAKLPDVSLERVTLSADTVVHLGERCLGKPRSPADAHTMLEALAGNTHHVTTAVAFRHPGGVSHFSVSSEVRFRRLRRTEIERYVASGEPMDKAGAYGIQGLGAGLVESVTGSHTAVVGLPLTETIEALAELGVTPS